MQRCAGRPAALCHHGTPPFVGFLFLGTHSPQPWLGNAIFFSETKRCHLSANGNMHGLLLARPAI